MLDVNTTRFCNFEVALSNRVCMAWSDWPLPGTPVPCTLFSANYNVREGKKRKGKERKAMKEIVTSWKGWKKEI